MRGVSSLKAMLGAMFKAESKAILTFMFIVALTGLGLGLSDTIFANFFKDAYSVNELERGFIEIPRETPGVISVVILSLFAFMGDIRLSMTAQVLSFAGIVVLGLVTPGFEVMLIFLFINSLGMHMFMPLSDSIGMSLAREGSFGSIMGRFKGIQTGFTMVAGIIAFVGFKVGVFSFEVPVKGVFLIAAAAFLIVFMLLGRLRRLHSVKAESGKVKLTVRKRYALFYLLAALYGARKQIMYVFGPWVLIELLSFRTDTMSLLSIVGSGIGIFFMPAVGRWIDRYGTARIMMVEAGAFICIYLVYGFLSAGLSGGWILPAGMAVAVAFGVNVADRMSIQFGMVRAVYMRSIAVDPDDVTPTLSFGMTLDHILSISSAMVCGFLWWNWGPQYVFVFAGFLSACNMLVAFRIRRGTFAPDVA
ncbi:MAG: MFS transporter [Oscillospiraceae bacterium]|nr:MFS transporter [Oscillospiraceae bacterium]